MKNITIGIIAREEKINNTSFEAITKNKFKIYP